MSTIGEVRLKFYPNSRNRIRQVYIACEVCGKERWVNLVRGFPEYKLCQSCGTKKSWLLDEVSTKRILGLKKSWDNPERKKACSERNKGKNNPFYGKKQKPESIAMMVEKNTKKIDISPTREWGYFIGLVLGDGSLCKTTGGNYKISVSSTRPEIVDKFYNCVLNLGLYCSYEIANIKPEWLEKSIIKNKTSTIRYSAVLRTKSVYLWMRQLKSEDFHFNIPDIVYQNNDMLCGFLQGFYDAEGGVYPKKKDKGYSIESFSKHESNLRQVQKCLSILGINSTMIIRGDRIASRLVIGNYDDRVKFRELVGFRIQRKQNKLNEMVKPNKIIHSVELYLHCMDLVSKGYQYTEIEKMVGINASTIGGWVFKKRHSLETVLV